MPLILAVCALLTACAASEIAPYGPIVSKSLPIPTQYDELEVSHAFEVVMSDTATSATFCLDSALFNRLVFQVKDGTLKIGLKSGAYRHIQQSSVVLPCNRALHDIELSGASSFTSDIALEASEISIDVSGASQFKGSVQQAAEVEVDASGASEVVVAGSAAVIDIDISGASSLDASKLDAKWVKGDISGASNAEVVCCQGIEVDISGASHLRYGTVDSSCNPALNIHTSGSSSAERR